MRIVVTGSSGMVGSVLCEALLGAGHEVIPVDRRPNEWNADLDRSTLLVDLLDDAAVAALPTAGIDAVVHLAANARVHDLVVEPSRARENFVSTFNALEYSRRCGAHFVFSSSREVYGNQGFMRYHEDQVDPDLQESPYAASKLAGEALIRSYRRSYGHPFTIVRLSNVYGRNDLSDRFIPIAVGKALTGDTLTIFGREKRLDFTYVDDTIDGLVRVLERRERVNGETLNLASGVAYSLVEAAEMVASLTEQSITMDFAESRPGEVTSYEADITKARSLLDFNPRWSLDDGLAEAVRWYVARYREE